MGTYVHVVIPTTPYTKLHPVTLSHTHGGHKYWISLIHSPSSTHYGASHQYSPIYTCIYVIYTHMYALHYIHVWTPKLFLKQEDTDAVMQRLCAIWLAHAYQQVYIIEKEGEYPTSLHYGRGRAPSQAGQTMAWSCFGLANVETIIRNGNSSVSYTYLNARYHHRRSLLSFMIVGAIDGWILRIELWLTALTMMSLSWI